LPASGATAQSKDIVVDPKGEVPYVIDQRNVVVKSGADLCWRTGYWTPGAAGDTKAGELPVACECDKDVVGADKCAPASAQRRCPSPGSRRPRGSCQQMRFQRDPGCRQHLRLQQGRAHQVAKANLDSAVIAPSSAPVPTSPR
jgi:OOP family OmpA-OmpF porin